MFFVAISVSTQLYACNIQNTINKNDFIMP